jgi:hypothetical protein
MYVHPFSKFQKTIIFFSKRQSWNDWIVAALFRGLFNPLKPIQFLKGTKMRRILIATATMAIMCGSALAQNMNMGDGMQEPGMSKTMNSHAEMMRHHKMKHHMKKKMMGSRMENGMNKSSFMWAGYMTAPASQSPEPFPCELRKMQWAIPQRSTTTVSTFEQRWEGMVWWDID